MPDIRTGVISSDTEAITMDWLLTPTNLLDETNELQTAVLIAFNTDATADQSDVLPDPRSSDRRGWWADYNATVLWGAWPIGSKFWLLRRAKIVDGGASEGATTTRVRNYTRACLQPFVDNGICSLFTIDSLIVDSLGRRISVEITMYRGPKAAIKLKYQPAWEELFPGS